MLMLLAGFIGGAIFAFAVVLGILSAEKGTFIKNVKYGGQNEDL
jgi:hypothetical protein